VHPKKCYDQQNFPAHRQNWSKVIFWDRTRRGKIWLGRVLGQEGERILLSVKFRRGTTRRDFDRRARRGEMLIAAENATKSHRNSHYGGLSASPSRHGNARKRIGRNPAATCSATQSRELGPTSIVPIEPVHLTTRTDLPALLEREPALRALACAIEESVPSEANPRAQIDG
jgi:hypothetical protein